MELIVISDSQIKLMLSGSDMAPYSGTAGEIVRQILRDAQRLPGIGQLDGRIFVEYYPSKGGGCEMFVTRLCAPHSVGTGGGCELVLKPEREGPARGRKTVYSFPAMADLLACCAALLRLPYAGESAAYYDPVKKTYYLTLDAPTSVAAEHLGSLCPSDALYYINEHCDVVCAENAAGKLGVLA